MADHKTAIVQRFLRDVAVGAFSLVWESGTDPELESLLGRSRTRQLTSLTLLLADLDENPETSILALAASIGSELREHDHLRHAALFAKQKAFCRVHRKHAALAKSVGLALHRKHFPADLILEEVEKHTHTLLFGGCD